MDSADSVMFEGKLSKMLIIGSSEPTWFNGYLNLSSSAGSLAMKYGNNVSLTNEMGHTVPSISRITVSMAMLAFENEL